MKGGVYDIIVGSCGLSLGPGRRLKLVVDSDLAVRSNSSGNCNGDNIRARTEEMVELGEEWELQLNLLCKMYQILLNK